MLLNHKVCLKLTPHQTAILDAMSLEGLNLYNHFLSQQIEQFEKDKSFINYYVQQKELKDYKCDLLGFDVKKEVLRGLHANYSSFFKLIQNNRDLNHKTPKLKSPNYFFTLSFVQFFTIENRTLIISYGNKQYLNIYLPYVEPIRNLTCKRVKDRFSDIKQLKISKQNGKYFATISYEKQEEPEKPVDNSKILSIDLGKKNLLSVYDVENNQGIVFSSKHLSKNQKFLDKRTDQLKSKRDLKKRNSRKSKQINKKLTKLFSKKKTQTNLILQKITRDLSLQNKTILIGDLKNIKRNILTPFHSLNRQMQVNWNLGTFTKLLEYKCKLRGQKVVKVNEAWTSKTCCKCGAIDHGLTLKDREYNCSCGFSINRDINGAINIYKNFLTDQNLGDYNTPLDVESISVSERFDWCNHQQMNKRLLI